MTERLDFLMVMIDKISAPAKRATAGLKGINKQLKGIGSSTALAKLGKGASRASKSVGSLSERGDRLISLSANLNLAGDSARRLSKQMAGIFLGPIQEAAEFDRSMSKVRAVTNDFTDSQTELARVLGRDTKFTANEAAQGMANLAIAGFSAQEQMDSLAGVLSLDAAAGMGDLGQTAEIAAGVLKGFGLEANKMTEVGDILTRTFTSSQTALGDLGQALSFVAPIAKTAGISLTETAIVLGVMGDASIRGTRAGTGLRLIMSRLAGTSSEATAAMKKLGIATEDSAGNLLPITNVLEDLSKEFSKLGTAKQLQLATKLFGRVGATPGAALLNDLAKTTGSFDKMRLAMDDTGKTAKSVAAIMEDNLADDVIKVESAFSSLQITIGNLFTPELRVMAGVLKDDVFPALEAWVKENETLTKTLVGTAAAVSVIAAGFGSLATFAGVGALIAGAGFKGAALASFGKSLRALMTPVRAFGTGLKFLARSAIPAIVAAFKGMAAGISGAISVSLVSAVAAGMALVLVPIVVWWDDVKTLIAKIPPDMTELGADMAQGLIDGWKNTFIGGILEDVGALVFDIEKMLGIASPSKVMMGIGDNMAKGLNQGMNGGANANAPSRFAGAAASSMAGGGGGARTMIMKPTISITLGSGAGTSEADGVVESVQTALTKFWDDASTALGAS